MTRVLFSRVVYAYQHLQSQQILDLTKKGSMCIPQVFEVRTDGVRWPGISLDCYQLCCLERFTRLVDKLETMSNNTVVAHSQICANTWERGTACGCGAAVALVQVSSIETSYLEVEWMLSIDVERAGRGTSHALLRLSSNSLNLLSAVVPILIRASMERASSLIMEA